MSTPIPGAEPPWPRSTPIPGADPPPPPSPPDLPTPPPTPDLPPTPNLPPGAPAPVPPSAFGTNPFGGLAPALNPQPRRFRVPLGLVTLLVMLAVAGGVVLLVVRSVHKTVDKVEQQARDASEEAAPGLSKKDRSALGVDPSVTALWEGTAASSLAAAFEAAVPGTPSRFVEMVVYPDYALATAQDPVKTTHVDTYLWRAGTVGSPTPEQNRTDLEGKTFTIAEVPWDKLAGLVTEATSRLGVEDATSRYLIIDKGTFGGTGLAVRVYVSGPRSSGYVQADATGTIVKVYG